MIAFTFRSRRIVSVRKCIAACVACAFLTGCWDSKEIDKLSIIQGVAIDTNQDMLELTYQHLIAQKSKKNTYTNVTTLDNDSIQAASRDQAKLVSHAPLYNFIRLVLISDQALKKTRIDELLDTFTRSYKPSRKSLVMIVKGNAKEALTKLGKHKDMPAFDLEELAANSVLNSKIPRKTRLGEVSIHISQGTDFIIQRLVTNESNQLAGAALVSGTTKKFVSWVNEKDVIGINWMLGSSKGSIIKVEDPKTKQHMVFEVEDAHSKLIPHVNGEDLSFTVRIKTDIKLNETSVVSAELLKEPFIRTAKETVEGEIRQIVLQSLHKLQKEMRADVAGFGRKVKVNYPAYWDQVKDHWQDTFSKIPVDVQVKVQIERTGAYTKGAGA
ncbi:Ger(x)C family spore germination protein [Paenibacillus jilunlii]|uniref:Spore germination protein n=1 Tax=Paenibacillus jilunlii TaxID=682956 RepID=A0A1G9QAZ8_9BACL|nr:Ger(x)C family spore germination protein [Paenibacillus jilunlii]KWX73102.1 spore gernimation protein GerA [Paenibacillus jilunlii]SDM08244.1 spore germination protein [Paenibacillus jilunlii]